MSRWWGRSKRAPEHVEPFSIGGALRVDVHSHLVPGVDDGAQTLTESLDLIAGLVNLGYQGAILTPHIYPGLYPNSETTLRPAFQELEAASAERWPDFHLHLAAEYYADDTFLDSIRQKELLSFPVGLADAVLFEMGFHEVSPVLFDAVFELQLAGFQPVLAHVERYPYIVEQPALAAKLHDRGVWLTANAASLAGAYGPPVQIFVEDLMKKGWIRMLCSDAHGQRHLDALGAIQTHAGLKDALDQAGTWVQRELFAGD